MTPAILDRGRLKFGLRGCQELHNKVAGARRCQTRGRRVSTRGCRGSRRCWARAGHNLSGLVVERVAAEASLGELAAPPADRHVIAVHENTPVNLYWRTGRSVHHRLIAPGQIIVSPADYSNRRAWNERTEDVLVWLTPDSPYLGASTFALRPQIGGHDPSSRSCSATWPARSIRAQGRTACAPTHWRMRSEPTW